MENNIFHDFLATRGLKLTRERMGVLRQIFAIHGHFEPEDLYLKIKSSGIKASRASVYRTLNLLVDSGLVERISRSNRGNVYEHTYGHTHHDHMVCASCGEVIEFFSENLEEIQDEICTKYDFSGTSHTLEIRGECRACQKRKK
jgi:Fur family ferric uptake transcriptional regulator